MSNNDDDVKNFTEQYLQSCQDQIKALAENPKVLQQALKPFMDLQEQSLLQGESQASDASADTVNEAQSSSSDVVILLQKVLHRIQGVRKKALPDISDKLDQILNRLTAIEDYLGVDSQDASESSVDEDHDN